MRFVNQWMKSVIISSALLVSTPLLADWEPEMCWMDEDLSILQDTNYITLKKEVCETLKNSWCSQEKVNLLMDLVMIEKPQICVEIGACTGSSVLPVAKALAHLRQGKVYAIDAWSNAIAVRNMQDNDPNKPWWSTVDMNSIKQSFAFLTESPQIKDHIETISLPSEEAVSQFDEIDFLHLDGDYSEAGALKDVELYIPRVKQGGYILLSNLFTMINGKQPKLKAFCSLMDTCDLIIEIENDNAVLFRKN